MEENVKKTIWEMIRYVIAGAIAMGVHYAIYLPLNIWLNYNVSYTIGYLMSLVVHYFLAAKFIYRADTGVRNGTGYFIAQGINYVLQMAFLNLFIWQGMSKNIAIFPAYALAGILNYILLKFMFKKLK